MNSDRGTFVPLDDKAFKEEKQKEVAALVQGKKPDMPTLQVGEVFEIKRVRFVVIGLKNNGRLRAKMLRDDQRGEVGHVVDWR